MNHRIYLTPQSKSDLRRIRNWLLGEDEELAARFVKGFRMSRNRLIEIPEMGSEYRARDSTFRRRVRVEGFDRYWVYYAFDGMTLRILRVIHSSQNAETEMQK